MSTLITQLYSATILLKKNFPFVFLFIALLYGIHIVNWILGYNLKLLGIYPRKLFGLVGIFFSAFIHANFNHLFFNSIPLFLLASFVLLAGFPTFLCVSTIIILLSGLATWLLARPGFHIGASGLIMGYWSYLLINAYHQDTILSIALAIVCVYYLGGLALNLVPTDTKSSWEAHIFGFLSGLAAAFISPLFIHYFMISIT